MSNKNPLHSILKSIKKLNSKIESLECYKEKDNRSLYKRALRKICLVDEFLSEHFPQLVLFFALSFILFRRENLTPGNYEGTFSYYCDWRKFLDTINMSCFDLVDNVMIFRDNWFMCRSGKYIIVDVNVTKTGISISSERNTNVLVTALFFFSECPIHDDIKKRFVDLTENVCKKIGKNRNLLQVVAGVLILFAWPLSKKGGPIVYFFVYSTSIVVSIYLSVNPEKICIGYRQLVYIVLSMFSIYIAVIHAAGDIFERQWGECFG